MLIIRLQRVGKTKKPVYRLIISEKARDTKGTYLELLGTYNPHNKTDGFLPNVDRIKYWISKGAQMSETINNLLVKNSIIEGKKKRVIHLSKKRQTKIDEKKKADVEAAQKAEAAKIAAAEAEKAAAEAAKAAAAEAAATPVEQAPETPVENNTEATA